MFLYRNGLNFKTVQRSNLFLQMYHGMMKEECIYALDRMKSRQREVSIIRTNLKKEKCYLYVLLYIL